MYGDSPVTSSTSGVDPPEAAVDCCESIPLDRPFLDAPPHRLNLYVKKRQDVVMSEGWCISCTMSVNKSLMKRGQRSPLVRVVCLLCQCSQCLENGRRIALPRQTTSESSDNSILMVVYLLSDLIANETEESTHSFESDPGGMYLCVMVHGSAGDGIFNQISNLAGDPPQSVRQWLIIHQHERHAFPVC